MNVTIKADWTFERVMAVEQILDNAYEELGFVVVGPSAPIRGIFHSYLYP
jgi:predicted ATPase